MDNQKIGNFIAEARKQKNLTQQELADLLHVTDKAVSKWERGIGLPDLKMIQPLARALEVGVLELMSGEPVIREDSPDAQAYAEALRAYDATKTARETERLRLRLERWQILAAVFAIAFFFVSGFALKEDLFLAGYLWIYLPVLSQILAALLLALSIIRACRKRKCTWLLLFGLICLFWPAIQVVILFIT